jgi:hypothetical protein
MKLNDPTSAEYITKNTKRAPKKINFLKNGGSKVDS